MSAVRWQLTAWSGLSCDRLYALLRLRSAIFVVEQNCVFLDLDGLDRHCDHLCGFDAQGELVAYARLLPPGVKHAEAAIGRIVVAPPRRGTGLGHALMRQALAACAERYPGQAVLIEAQQHLEPFYAHHGFATIGSPYLEDGIPHVHMRLPPPG
jgi:ElaA protein